MNEFLTLASYYDLFMDSNGLDKWKKFVVKTIKKYAKGDNGVDIGSGTGIFTRSLIENGFSVTGVEPSIAMLNEAVNIGGAEYIKQNILNLRGFSDLAFATAINDVINYINPKNLLKAFKNVNNCLSKGGIFLFDISSEYKLKNILGNNFFAEDKTNVTYLWYNTLKADKVIMDMTFFTTDENSEKYTRYDETYEEFIYTEEMIETALAEAGFTVLKKLAHLGKNVCENSDRINYIVKKI